MYYRNAQAAVVVYDVTKAVSPPLPPPLSLIHHPQASLEQAKTWVKELQRQANPKYVRLDSLWLSTHERAASSLLSRGTRSTSSARLPPTASPQRSLPLRQRTRTTRLRQPLRSLTTRMRKSRVTRRESLVLVVVRSHVRRQRRTPRRAVYSSSKRLPRRVRASSRSLPRLVSAPPVPSLLARCGATGARLRRRAAKKIPLDHMLAAARGPAARGAGRAAATSGRVDLADVEPAKEGCAC